MQCKSAESSCKYCRNSVIIPASSRHRSTTDWTYHWNKKVTASVMLCQKNLLASQASSGSCLRLTISSCYKGARQGSSYRQLHFPTCRKALLHEPQCTVVLCLEAAAFSTFAKLMFSTLDIVDLKSLTACIEGQFKILTSLWLRHCCIATNSRS